jgi:hypothetical protein
MASTVITTDDFWVIPACAKGEKKYFKSVRTHNMWRKLHTKKCKDCQEARLIEISTPFIKPCDGKTVSSFKNEEKKLGTFFK